MAYFQPDVQSCLLSTSLIVLKEEDHAHRRPKNTTLADCEAQTCNTYTQNQLNSFSGSANVGRYSSLAQNISSFVTSWFQAVMKMLMRQEGKSPADVDFFENLAGRHGS